MNSTGSMTHQQFPNEHDKLAKQIGPRPLLTQAILPLLIDATTSTLQLEAWASGSRETHHQNCPIIALTLDARTVIIHRASGDDSELFADHREALIDHNRIRSMGVA